MISSLLASSIFTQPLTYDPTLSPVAFGRMVMSFANPQEVNHIQDRNGVRWIHQAAFHGKKEHVLILASLGPRNIVNIKDKNGDTPLLWSEKSGARVQRHKTEFVWRHLLGLGADPNVVNSEGDTLLHIAARSRDLGKINYLLLMGANHQLKDVRDKTPLDIVQEYFAKNPDDPYRITFSRFLAIIPLLAQNKGWYQTVVRFTKKTDIEERFGWTFEFVPAPPSISDPQAFRRANPHFMTLFPGYPSPAPHLKPIPGKALLLTRTLNYGWHVSGILPYPYHKTEYGFELFAGDLEGVVKRDPQRWARRLGGP